MADADDLDLESPPAGAVGDLPAARARRGDWPYLYQLAHYEQLFQASNRTLKGWLAIGRGAAPPDLPPYDDPTRMADWYGRHKKNRIPDHLLALASGRKQVPCDPSPGPIFSAPSGHVTTSSSDQAALLDPLPAAVSPPAAAIPSAAAKPVIATGFSATLERLRAAEAAAGEKYTQLILEGKDAEAESAERRWQKLRADLRDYERDAQKVLSAQGKLWPADEVAAALYEMHTVILQSFESLYSRIETELRTLPREEAKRLYLAECRRLRANLVANKFTAPPPPEHLAAA